MISSENGLLRGVVMLNVRGRDVVSFVEEAKLALGESECSSRRATTSSGAASMKTSSARGPGCCW